MELNDEAKQAVSALGEAINAAVEKSARVAEAIDNLRELGYEPNLTLKLDIGLQQIGGDAEEVDPIEELPENVELDLTEDDLKTLRRMKIRLDS